MRGLFVTEGRSGRRLPTLTFAIAFAIAFAVALLLGAVSAQKGWALSPAEDQYGDGESTGQTSGEDGPCAGAAEQLAAEQPNVPDGTFESYLNYVSDVDGCLTFEGTDFVGGLSVPVYDPDTGEDLGILKDLDPDLSSGDFSVAYEEFCGAFPTRFGETEQEYFEQSANDKERAILDPDGDGLACGVEDTSPPEGGGDEPSVEGDPCENPVGGLIYVPAVNGCLTIETIYALPGIINGPVYDADDVKELLEDDTGTVAAPWDTGEELGILKDLVDIDDMYEQIGFDLSFAEFCEDFPTTDIEGYEVDGVSLAGLTAQEYYDQLANAQEKAILDPNGDGLACAPDDEAFLSGDFGDYDETLFEETWSGLVTQIAEDGAESEFWVEADIMPVSGMTEDFVGEVVGEATLVGLDCGGVWILKEVNEDSVVVEERITDGTISNCVESVPITLTPREDDTLEYYFLDINGSVGEGMLTRQGSGAPEGDPRLPSEIMGELGMTELPDTGGPTLPAAFAFLGIIALLARRTR